jgi:hypothetical protein
MVLQSATQHLPALNAATVQLFTSIKGGAINPVLNLFLSMYRPSSFIEDFGSPGKDSLVCVGLLAARLFNVFIFCHVSLQVKVERGSGRGM